MRAEAFPRIDYRPDDVAVVRFGHVKLVIYLDLLGLVDAIWYVEATGEMFGVQPIGRCVLKL